MEPTKHCRLCGESKPLTEFYKAPGCVDGLRGECRDCFRDQRHQRERDDPNRLEANRARVRRWRIDNEEYYRERKREYQQTDSYKRSFRRWYLREKYGLTLEQYDEMLERQGGGCAICGKPPGDIALHVDHCHETGRVRGLLCFACNAGLGQFKHDPELLVAAATYAGAHWRIQELKAEARRARDGGDTPSG
jgi:hypothetical protein